MYQKETENRNVCADENNPGERENEKCKTKDPGMKGWDERTKNGLEMISFVSCVDGS